MWVQRRTRIRQLADVIDLPVCFFKQDSETGKAVSELRFHSVIIEDDLKVEFEPDAKDLYDSSPFCQDVGAADLPRVRNDFYAAAFHGKGVLSRVLRVQAAVRAARLHAQADESRQIAMLSASGESVG